MDLGIFEFVIDNTWRVLPIFIISVGLGVVARSVGAVRLLSRVVGSRPIVAIVAATAIGAFSPLCSCTVIPVVAGLLTAGVPLAPVMAFWIASPTMDPEIFVLSVSFLGVPLAFARLGATLGVSILAGVATHALVRAGHLDRPLRHESSEATADTETVSPTGGVALQTRSHTRSWLIGRPRSLEWSEVAHTTLIESWRLGRWLLLAFFVEALILDFVPQEAIASLLGSTSIASVPLAALIGVPLYFNNLAALPVVEGLLAQGMGAGAAISFLVAGPVTTAPAMLAVRPLVRGRVFVLYVAVGLLGAIVAGLVTSMFL